MAKDIVVNRQGTIEYLELAVAVLEVYQENLNDAIKDLQEVQKRLLKVSKEREDPKEAMYTRYGKGKCASGYVGFSFY